MAERLNLEAPVLNIKILSPDAKLPTYAHPGDAGFDLYSPIAGSIEPRKRKKIALGIAGEIPQDWVVFFKDKSGQTDREGTHVMAGVIDSIYRGEWQLILYNTDDSTFVFEQGQKIAQGVLLYAPQAKILQVEQLSETQRGEGGFGSTGKK
ncbi:MAG TPA: dUTP diphosphatase [Patescibacteria group bacterium]